MVGFIKTMKSFEEGAIQEAEEAKREVELLFLAMDCDCTGSIELSEFLQLSETTGTSEERLTELFHAKVPRCTY